MKLEITKKEYEILIEFFKLHDIKANIKQVIMDEMLVTLGFAEKVPCIVELDKDVIGNITEVRSKPVKFISQKNEQSFNEMNITNLFISKY